MTLLAVPSFGGGIVLEGSADTQRTDELRECDSYDIGARGQLVAASDRENAFQLANIGPMIYGFEIVHVPQGSFLLFVGITGTGNIDVDKVNLDGSAEGLSGIGVPNAFPSGLSITFASLPYVGADAKQKRVVLISLGARPTRNPSEAPGLWALVYDSTAPSYTVQTISKYDALGTGNSGEYPGGTKAKQLKPRGIIVYNNHVFLWGYDSHDTGGAANLDGPNRLMFSNIGNPLKYGVDPAPPPDNVEADRSFTDSDAFTIGGAGAFIRAGCVWAGKLWLATSQGLHYVEGFGRESFLTNGALPVSNTQTTIGPHALIEGPDRLLHGVSDEGHWIFNGSDTMTPGARLRDYASKSTGYWDLIWTNPGAADSFPGKTNQDLVWMFSVPEVHQVWIGIPFCSIANGYGVGTDTVVLKYSCLTGGYTRQLFPGVTITAADLYKRDASAIVQTLLAVPAASSGATNNVQRYGYKLTANLSPVMPAALPVVTAGDYAPYGIDGTGITRKFYFTISWEGALPLVFTITPVNDGAPSTPVQVTIGPIAPTILHDGDLWVDTSGTDPSLGNGTAGAFTPANPGDYLLWRWVTSWLKWSKVPGMGQQGTRVSIPVAHDVLRGTRLRYRVVCVAAAGRYQIESIAFGPPDAIRGAA